MKAIIFTLLLMLTSINCIFIETNFDDAVRTQTLEFPSMNPLVFLPEIISSNHKYEFGSALSKDMKTVFFGLRLNEDWKAEIRYTSFENGHWSTSQKLNLNPQYTYNDPLLTDDEKKLYFVSNQPFNAVGEAKDFDIWYIEKTVTGWSEPINAGDIINSEKDEFYISITDNGTVYFASNVNKSEENKWDFDIYYSKRKDGQYQKAIRLGESINTEFFECDAFVSPDESYMIFCSSRPGGFGEGDLYISFKNKEGQWSKAVNMGAQINTESHDFCPFVTKDNKWFFYSSNQDIYWVNSSIIDNFE